LVRVNGDQNVSHKGVDAIGLEPGLAGLEQLVLGTRSSPFCRDDAVGTSESGGEQHPDIRSKDDSTDEPGMWLDLKKKCTSVLHHTSHPRTHTPTHPHTHTLIYTDSNHIRPPFKTPRGLRGLLKS
jgi:hypothetical protein